MTSNTHLLSEGTNALPNCKEVTKAGKQNGTTNQQTVRGGGEETPNFSKVTPAL